MKKALLIIYFLPIFCFAQNFVTQGICTQSGTTFTLNGISQSPYAGRFFCKSAVNLNNDFDLVFTAYLGNVFNNGMAFIFMPGAQPTATSPATVINTDNIHNFGTGSISSDFIIEFDIRGSFCAAGQNTSYEPTSDINHISYWKNNSACNFGNYFSAYSALGTVNYYAYEPYRIKWTKSTNTLETYYNNVLIKSNVIDLVGLLGTTVYWGFSAGCYCVTGGPTVSLLTLNGALVPVELINFNAQKKGKEIILNWQTAQEQNSSHFIVEKSTDGTRFSSLRRVEAAGNSNTPRNYEISDAASWYGNNYYRIKMIDMDGSFKYSKVVSVKMENKPESMIVFPNPAVNDLEIQLPSSALGTVIIQIRGVHGNLLKERSIRVNSNMSAVVQNISDLRPGLYELVILYNGNTEVKKFIKE